MQPEIPLIHVIKRLAELQQREDLRDPVVWNMKLCSINEIRVLLGNDLVTILDSFASHVLPTEDITLREYQLACFTALERTLRRQTMETIVDEPAQHTIIEPPALPKQEQPPAPRTHKASKSPWFIDM
jgi:hypothetical protein